MQRVLKKKLAFGLALFCVLTLWQCRVNENEYLMNVDYRDVILDGYDTVAFFTKRKSVKGDSGIQARYNKAIFYFSSEGNKKLFQADPGKYAPQFGGWCAYAVSRGHVSPIGVDFFSIQEGRLILQHNQRAWDLYGKNPKGNLKRADENWPELLFKHRQGSYVAY